MVPGWEGTRGQDSQGAKAHGGMSMLTLERETPQPLGGISEAAAS